jgi:hypothetical protein
VRRAGVPACSLHGSWRLPLSTGLLLSELCGVPLRSYPCAGSAQALPFHLRWSRRGEGVVWCCCATYGVRRYPPVPCDSQDTRRAMVKSFQTSNGKVLSTNWGEVSKKDYEKEEVEELSGKKKSTS